ncbi:MAG: methyltransferase domain-containing protein, partial [Erythrobacter sp.]
STISATLAMKRTLIALKHHARGDLADFGCGTAPFYGEYSRLADSVCWIDWPSSPHETQHLDVVADLNQPVDLPADQFDTIFTSSVLEHIWKHDVFWDEMTRTLRPDGKIILIVPFLYWLHEEPHDYFRWTRHALTKACEERSLNVVELEPYGGGADVLVDLTVRALAAVSLRLAKLVGRPMARLLSHASIRSRGQNAKEKLPLGYVLVAQKPAKN